MSIGAAEALPPALSESPCKPLMEAIVLPTAAEAAVIPLTSRAAFLMFAAMSDLASRAALVAAAAGPVAAAVSALRTYSAASDLLIDIHPLAVSATI